MRKAPAVAVPTEHAQGAKLASVCSKQRPNNFFWAFISLLALYCWWVYSLPLFPTQDDGIHLYYVDVIRHLLAGNTEFGAFYFIRNPPPPYIVHYALLLLLTGFLKPVLAEKCVVCLILVLTAFGFRFLAGGFGRNAGLVSLWCIPITLSWPLFMGFHNYCLSLGLSLWAWGIWLRARRRRKPALWFAFLLNVVLILFTHPVPLLWLIAVIGADLALHISQQKLRTNGGWTAALSQFKWDLTIAILACCSLGYIALFVDRESTARDLAAPVSRVLAVAQLLRLRWMSFAIGGISTVLYRCGLYIVFIAGIVLSFRGLRRRWRKRRLRESDVALLCGVALAIALPLLPPSMNGSDHFANRLQVVVFFTVLAAAGAIRIPRRPRNAIAVSACLFGLFALGMANYFVRPVSRDVARIENAPVAHHKAGLFFDAPVTLQDKRLKFNPFYWVSGRYFRRAEAVMLNDPWTRAPYPLPLLRKQNALTAPFTAADFEDSHVLHEHLMKSPEDRAAVFSGVDVLLFVGAPETGMFVPDPLVKLDSSHHWNCKNNAWYSVCEADPNAPTSITSGTKGS